MFVNEALVHTTFKNIVVACSAMAKGQRSDAASVSAYSEDLRRCACLPRAHVRSLLLSVPIPPTLGVSWWFSWMLRCVLFGMKSGLALSFHALGGIEKLVEAQGCVGGLTGATKVRHPGLLCAVTPSVSNPSPAFVCAGGESRSPWSSCCLWRY